MKNIKLKDAIICIRAKIRELERNITASMTDWFQVKGMVKIIQICADVPLNSPLLAECRELISIIHVNLNQFSSQIIDLTVDEVESDD